MAYQVFLKAWIAEREDLIKILTSDNKMNGNKLMEKLKQAHYALPYLLFLMIGFLIFPSTGRDDVHITYWAAHALSKFGQIVNYSGERVEQSSSLLHTVLLFLATDITYIKLTTIGTLFSISCSVLTIWLLGKLSLLIEIKKAPAQWLLATATPFVYWSFSGLESTLVSAIITMLLIAYIKYLEDESINWSIFLGVLIFFYITVRPESIFVLSCFFIGMIIVNFIQSKKIKANVVLLFSGIFIFLLLTLWRAFYFGDLFPQPVEAKIGSNIPLFTKLKSGIAYLIKSTIHYPVLILLIFPAVTVIVKLVRNNLLNNKNLPIIVFSFAYLGFVLFSGGDWMEGARFFVPVLPLMIAISFILCPNILSKKFVIYLIVMANILSILMFAHKFSTGAMIADDSYKIAQKSNSTDPFSFFEYQNKVHYRDIPFLQSVSPIIASYLEAFPDKRFNIMSVQAGMIAFHLFQENYGRMTFIDPAGLSSREFTKCPLSLQWGKSSTGLKFGYRKYFPLRHEFETQCNIASPDFIFDLDTPNGATSDLVSKNGYVIVYRQSGFLKGAFPFNGWPIDFSEFFAVRDDLFQKLPVKPSSLTLSE